MYFGIDVTVFFLFSLIEPENYHAFFAYNTRITTQSVSGQKHHIGLKVEIEKNLAHFQASLKLYGLIKNFVLCVKNHTESQNHKYDVL